nr:polysaccharide deacetylase family protein [uncultured Flavobacterium sp.]
MKCFLFPIVIVLLFLVGCQSKPEASKKEVILEQNKVKKEVPKKEINRLEQILSKPEVPILCYHRIRNFESSDGPNMRVYSVTPSAFAEQMKALSDNGFHTILPDQLKEYLLYNAKLPSKPVMITFDDTREEQYSIGAAEMNKYGFKGAFFIMTISINRPKYMTEEQIKNLYESGHSIGTHSWDHHMVTKYTGDDWNIQLSKPKKRVESIIGKTVDYFAYPDGIWNKEAIGELEKSNYNLAFSLATKRDSTKPLFTIRRMIVSGNWSTSTMLKNMETTFNKNKILP